MIADHPTVHLFDLPAESVEIFSALIAATAAIIVGVLTTRTRRSVHRLRDNLAPSNGDTLATIIEGINKKVEIVSMAQISVLDAQHQQAERMDLIHSDLSHLRNENVDEHKDIRQSLATLKYDIKNHEVLFLHDRRKADEGPSGPERRSHTTHIIREDLGGEE